MLPIQLIPVGYVKNTRTEIKDDFWGGTVSEIELTENFCEDAFAGIESFSHLEIIYRFHKAGKEKILYGKGHPRGNTELPEVGIFAQRKKDRPNLLGATIVNLIKKEGNKIYVCNFDAINGTPVLDIKPVFREFFPSGEIVQPEWVTKLMNDYWKTTKG